VVWRLEAHLLAWELAQVRHTEREREAGVDRMVVSGAAVGGVAAGGASAGVGASAGEAHRDRLLHLCPFVLLLLRVGGE
jgi:hypothetical protein